MEKIHSDNVKDIIDFSTFKPSEEITFTIGEVNFINLSDGALKAITTLGAEADGRKIKVICIAPGKFEVWA